MKNKTKMKTDEEEGRRRNRKWKKRDKKGDMINGEK